MNPITSMHLPSAPDPTRIEIWGGHECTVARIGDSFRNQIAETGHIDRLGDLDAIAALGIRTLRYPILWETISPDDPDRSDWRWNVDSLGHQRHLHIGPDYAL